MVEQPADEPKRAVSVIFLSVECPACGANEVVVEVELGEKPVLSCLACRHTSQLEALPPA
jgi:ribosomal protein S27E